VTDFISRCIGLFSYCQSWCSLFSVTRRKMTKSFASER